GNNAVYLLNDSGSAWIGPSVLGSGAALNNSRCGVNVGSSSASGSGNNLTVNLALTFAAPAFSGAKNIYTFAHDNGNLSTGWEQKGSWMVNEETLLDAAVGKLGRAQFGTPVT